jgi:hypothetical protein
MTFATIPASIVSWRSLLCLWRLIADFGSTHHKGNGEGGIRTLGSLLRLWRKRNAPDERLAKFAKFRQKK